VVLSTQNLYKAAAVIWKTGIYPDSYIPDDRGFVSASWNESAEIAEAFSQFDRKELLVEPHGLMVVHINLKKTVNRIKGKTQ